MFEDSHVVLPEVSFSSIEQGCVHNMADTGDRVVQ